MAATITDAAHLTYDRTQPRWTGGTLKADVDAFIASASVIFSDELAGDRPVGNWIVILQDRNSQLPGGGAVASLPQWDSVVDAIYRMCRAAVVAQSGGGITAGQVAALLAAWNAEIGP